MIKMNISCGFGILIGIYAVISLVLSEEEEYDEIFHLRDPIEDFEFSAHRHRNMSEIELPPLIFNATEKHTATMIFLHDYAENGTWFEDELKQMRQPYMKVVCPYANKLLLSWILGTPMSSWFDFTGKRYPRCFNDSTGIKQASIYVHSLINEEIKHGIPPERIIISGFQQGALLALHSALSFPKKLGGIVALAPWHSINATLMEVFNPVNKDIPIFQASTDGNQYTSVNEQLEVRDHLLDHISHNVRFKIYKGLSTKTRSKEEFDDVGKFCKEHVQPI